MDTVGYVVPKVATLGLFTCMLAHILASSQAFHLSAPFDSATWRGRARPRVLRAVEQQRPHNGVGIDGGMGGQRDPELSITTFNVLAPIFKRVGSGRESDFRDAYLERHSTILDHLKVRCIELYR